MVVGEGRGGDGVVVGEGRTFYIQHVLGPKHKKITYRTIVDVVGSETSL